MQYTLGMWLCVSSQRIWRFEEDGCGVPVIFQPDSDSPVSIHSLKCSYALLHWSKSQNLYLNLSFCFFLIFSSGRPTGSCMTVMMHCGRHWSAQLKEGWDLCSLMPPFYRLCIKYEFWKVSLMAFPICFKAVARTWNPSPTNEAPPTEHAQTRQVDQVLMQTRIYWKSVSKSQMRVAALLQPDTGPEQSSLLSCGQLGRQVPGQRGLHGDGHNGERRQRLRQRQQQELCGDCAP